MKTRILTFAILIAGTLTSRAQTNPTIAVASPAIQGLTTSPKMAVKLINMELVKIAKYNVYDEYDVSEILKNNPQYQTECYGLTCLSALGKTLKVDFILSGSLDKIGNKIVISLKTIDISTSTIQKTIFKEFDNQEIELQRMIEITLKEMNGISVPKETSDQLSFKNEVITSNNLGRINNSGPRIGYAYLSGSLYEFARRDEDQGGLGIAPSLSMIGYQFEKQYVGTENFSALFETVVNISGLEQSSFIPTISLMNGFRFGKGGWEFAFGPSFGIQKTSKGFFDMENKYGKGVNHYWTQQEYTYNYMNLNPDFTSIPDPQYNYTTNLDKRGNASLSTRWVMAFGRTFRAGALNIPVNVFYSSVKKGNMVGVSVGFNVIKKKEIINKY